MPFTEEDLCAYDLSIACHGAGMDLRAISFILSTVSPEQVQRLVRDLQEKESINLAEVIKCNTSDSSAMRVTLLSLMSYGEVPSQSVSFDDDASANVCAKNLTGAKGDKLLETVVSLKPEYLQRVEMALESRERTSLDALLKEKVKDSSVVKLVNVIRAPTTAKKIATIVSDLEFDSAEDAVKLLTRFDYRTCVEIDRCIQTMRGLSLMQVLESSFQGKLRSIAEKWTRAKSVPGSSAPETGAEINAIFEEFGSGSSVWQEKLQSEQGRTEIVEELTAVRDRLRKIVEELPEISEDHPLAAAAAATSEEAGTTGSPSKKMPKSLSVVGRYKTIKFDANHKEDDSGDSFNTKLDLVVSYLTDVFSAADDKMSGALPHFKFWSIFADLDVVNLCFEEQEIHMMPQLISQDIEDNEGKIYYDEAIPELADDIIAGLTRKQLNVRETIEAQIREAGQVDLQSAFDEAQQETGYDAAETQPLPPDLMTQLQNTFTSFDKENKGYLTRDDFWYLIQMLNLEAVTTADELDALFTSFDANADGQISWEEALPRLTERIMELSSDLRDHWIGLEDASLDPPACYWYNLLDGASQWMTADEQAQYKESSADPDSSAPTGPTLKARMMTKVGLIANMNHLKKALTKKKLEKEKVEQDDALDATTKAQLLADIEIDYTEDLHALKRKQSDAKNMLQQRLDATKEANAKRLKARIDKKKRGGTLQTRAPMGPSSKLVE